MLMAGPNNASFGDVFRYDGKSFTNLTSKAGPHRFWDVLEDRRGNSWFVSTDSGAFYYNGKSFQQFTTTEGLADNRVMSVYEDKVGIIWLGTGNGLSRYDGKSFRNFKNPNPSRDGNGRNWNNDITTIIEDKTGKLWVGTRGTAFVFDGKTFTTLTYKGEPFLGVWGIMEDRKGAIWLGGFNVKGGRRPGGLYRYDGSAFTKASDRGAYAIIEDKNGNIWTTGADEPPRIGQVWSLSRYDQKSLYNKMPTVTEIKSQSGMLLGILEDAKGNIWFGSGGGVYQYDGKTLTDFKSKEGQK